MKLLLIIKIHKHLYFHFPFSIFIQFSYLLGGVPRQNLLPSNLRELGAFIGCMKEVSLKNNFKIYS
jgi:hypothetical protein